MLLVDNTGVSLTASSSARPYTFNSMLRKLIHHAAAFAGAFAIAYSTITLWLVPVALSLPPGHPLRGHLLWTTIAYPLRLALPATAGAALAFIPMRRRLQSWNIISARRTAIIGGLAGALWTPALHTMYAFARALDSPARGGTQAAFLLACGALSTLALYSPWLASDGPSTNSTTPRDGALDGAALRQLAESSPTLGGLGAAIESTKMQSR